MYALESRVAWFLDMLCNDNERQWLRSEVALLPLRASTHIPKSDGEKSDRVFGANFPKQNFDFPFRGAKNPKADRQETEIKGKWAEIGFFGFPFAEIRAEKKWPKEMKQH